MKGGVERIQNELGCLGLLSVSESDRVGSLLSGANNLELSVNDELEGATVLRDRLQAIRRGLARVNRDHNRASSILDQCEGSLRLGRDSVEQAVTNCQVILFLNHPFFFFLIMLYYSFGKLLMIKFKAARNLLATNYS